MKPSSVENPAPTAKLPLGRLGASAPASAATSAPSGGSGSASAGDAASAPASTAVQENLVTISPHTTGGR